MKALVGAFNHDCKIFANLCLKLYYSPGWDRPGDLWEGAETPGEGGEDGEAAQDGGDEEQGRPGQSAGTATPPGGQETGLQVNFEVIIFVLLII